MIVKGRPRTPVAQWSAKRRAQALRVARTALTNALRDLMEPADRLWIGDACFTTSDFRDAIAVIRHMERQQAATP